MDNEQNEEVVHDFSPRFRVYKSGRIERLREFTFVPASPDPGQNVAVVSKDVVVLTETGLSVRIFVPAEARRSLVKLPLLIYAHGGAFCMESAFSSNFHKYVSSLAYEANAIAVSIDYRLAPENPIPACYEDSWAAIQWVTSHQNNNGPEPWLNRHADFSRVFLAGDSAGANIIHNMLVRIGSDPLKIQGAMLVHPFFGNDKPDKLWEYLCIGSEGVYDHRLNPAGANPNMFERIRVDKLLICLAGEDDLKGRGVSYYEALKESGWCGEVEVVETEGEGHAFHVFHQDSDNALCLLKKLALFVNGF